MPKVTKLEDYRRKKRKMSEVTQTAFTELVSTTENYLNLLRPSRKDQSGIDKAIGILREIKFNGLYNPGFRKEVYGPLEDFLDEMYVEVEQCKDD